MNEVLVGNAPLGGGTFSGIINAIHLPDLNLLPADHFFSNLDQFAPICQGSCCFTSGFSLATFKHRPLYSNKGSVFDL